MIDYDEKIDAEEYMRLRQMVGWGVFPIEEAEAGIQNTYHIICARDQGKAVGCVRLLWDRGYIAYLSDVIVDPAYQGRGIGRDMVERCINHLKAGMKPGYRVKLSLMSAKGKEEFYEKFGFVVRPNESVGAGMDQWIVWEKGDE